jgi:hypothetical protein
LIEGLTGKSPEGCFRGVQQFIAEREKKGEGGRSPMVGIGRLPGFRLGVKSRISVMSFAISSLCQEDG